MSIAKFLNKDKVREVYENNLINMSDFEFKAYVYYEYNRVYIENIDLFEDQWFIKLLNKYCMLRFNISCLELLYYIGDMFYSVDIAYDVSLGIISESDLNEFILKQKKEDLF